MHFLLGFFNTLETSHLIIFLSNHMGNTSNDLLIEADSPQGIVTSHLVLATHYLFHLISPQITSSFSENGYSEEYFALPPLPSSNFWFSFSSRFFVMHIPLYFYLLAGISRYRSF